MMLTMLPPKTMTGQNIPCGDGQSGTLCSKFRLYCSGLMCHDAGDPCTADTWPHLVNFGEDGIWLVTCYEGAVVIG